MIYYRLPSCSFSLCLPVFHTGNGVQMQRDVQCCMLYSRGKVRTKDVLRFEVQTEGPDCRINAIMQVFQLYIAGGMEHMPLSLEEGARCKPLGLFNLLFQGIFNMHLNS